MPAPTNIRLMLNFVSYEGPEFAGFLDLIFGRLHEAFSKSFEVFRIPRQIPSVYVVSIATSQKGSAAVSWVKVFVAQVLRV